MSQAERGPNLEAFSGVARIVGFPPELLARSTIAIHLALAVTSTFSEGEARFRHDPFRLEDSAMREQFGEARYTDGVFGAHLRDLTEGDNPAQAEAARIFVHLGARLFAERVVAGGVQALNTRPSVLVDRSNRKLLFGEREYPLQLDPRTVVDYGPGLAGRFHADRQIIDLRQSNSTYQYFGLAKGDFVPAFLRHYLEVRGARNPEQVDAINERFFSVLSSGIEEGARRLIPPSPRPGPEAQSEGIADVVVASGIHSAGEAALNGVALAYPLLRKKGVLLIRGPQVPPDEDPGVRMDEMVQTGIEAGFRSKGVRIFDEATINPARLQYAQRVVIMQK